MSTTQNLAEDTMDFNQQQEGKNQYLTFILAGEEYGLDILRVQEIKGWDNVTKIPNAPHYIKGVMNLRGAIVPIIDLRSRFQLDALEYGLTTVVIVLKVEADDKQRIMGIVVDAVSDVYDIDVNNMRPPPDFGDKINVEFLKGLATVDEKMVIILDIDHLLTSNELHFLQSASQHGRTSNTTDSNSPRSLNVDLLEKTFQALAPKGEQIVRKFYQELFSRYPNIKPLFSDVSIEDQEKKLLSALNLVVNSLRKPEVLNETLHQLGTRHKDYGADAGMYQAVSATLLDVLKSAAGNQWTEEVHQTWSDALKEISNAMIKAANG